MTTNSPSRTDGPEIVLRLGRDDDWPIFADRQSRTFGAPVDSQEAEGWRSQIDFANACVVAEDVSNPSAPYLVGATAWKPMSITLPGREQLRVAGSGMTLVAPEYRRRGILRRMLDLELDLVSRQGYAAVIGTVSQGGLYDRFGYGPISYSQTASVRIGAPAAMRDCAPHRPLVRQLLPMDAEASIPEIFAAWQSKTVGAVARDNLWWKDHFHRRVHGADAADRVYYLKHPAGFLSYRLDLSDASAPKILVEDFCPLTDVAHTRLLDALFGMELFSEILIELPVDDPLRLKLANPHALTVREISDCIWMRILDVPACLRARGYGADNVDLALRVSDPKDKSTTIYEFSVEHGAGHCERVDTTKREIVSMGLPELAMVFLGTHRPSALATVGRIDAHSATSLGALDRVFAGDAIPFCNTKF